jgi:hypothetical protein
MCYWVKMIGGIGEYVDFDRELTTFGTYKRAMNIKPAYEGVVSFFCV